jgi:hypothetical protein
VTIILLVEGATETALKHRLKALLDMQAERENQPKVKLHTKDIMTLNEDKLRRRIRLELRNPQVEAVVGLIDVYPEFTSAVEAKDFLLRAADGEPRFYAHAAQYEVEAWLLPYWDEICRRIGVKQKSPGQHPEEVNLENPPSKRLAKLYQLTKPRRRKYVKTIEMTAILHDKDLTIAANRCPELKSLLNTLLKLGNLTPLQHE